MPYGIFHSDLAAQARGDQVVWRRLHKRFEIQVQLLDEVIDADRQPRVDAPVQRRPVINEQVGQVHLEMAAPERDVPEPALSLFGQAVEEDKRLTSRVSVGWKSRATGPDGERHP